MSHLKSIAGRVKALEKRSGANERENLIQEVLEIIRAHEIQNPGFIQRHLWPLCELSHNEIRSMGRGQKTLEDFKDRWKMSPQEWYERRAEWREADYLREIAEFNRANGDPYEPWQLTWKSGESNLSSPLKRRQGETENGSGKLQ